MITGLIMVQRESEDETVSFIVEKRYRITGDWCQRDADKSIVSEQKTY